MKKTKNLNVLNFLSLETKSQKAQVSIEYLVLLAFVIVLSLVVAITVRVLYDNALFAKADILDTRDAVLNSIFS